MRRARHGLLRGIALGCAALAVALGTALTLFVWHLGPLPLDTARERSRLVLDRNGELLRAYTTSAGRWRLPVSLDRLDQRYLAMLIAYEDKRFWQHGGIDLIAAGRAAWQLVSEGRIVSGASTITMQLARMLDATPTRSLRAKAMQVVRAIQLERAFTKREILELYLTLAPYGGNIEGVRAASLAYFGKEPQRLSLHEAALLVALPQSPETRRPDRNGNSSLTARNRVIARLRLSGLLTAPEADWAASQPVPNGRMPFPALAAHLADRLIAETPDAAVIRTTVDRALQREAEALAASQARRLGPKLSVALIAADHATGEVIAHAASPGYLDIDRNGPIDMTRAVRSPGSALKPFIYGLAFEDRLAHPATYIEDQPVRFGDYAPKNFDDGFRGTVTVAEALQLSLNVPAVKLLAAVTPARLSGRFRHAGFPVEIPRNLSVALGGIGLTLEHLTGLYAALARGGKPVRLRFRQGEPGLDPQGRADGDAALLSPLAAWYVTEILRGAQAPDHAATGRIAFKTGTSYGYRDAWAAGYDGRHIVAAWAGRADNSSTPGLLGLTAAAPVVFDMFAAIAPRRAPFPPAPATALLARTAELPVPLQRFRDADTDRPTAQSPAETVLRIAFPPDNAEIELAQDETGKVLPLAVKAEGGVLPLTWLADGAPIEAPPHRREAFWTPPGKGFSQLTVIDAKGRSERVRIRVR